eukprot:2372162-Pyramimonas_sp.AAC.1
MVMTLYSADLDEDGMTAIAAAIASISQWRKTCRGKAASTMSAEQALQETMARLTKTLVEQDPEVVDASIMDAMEKHMQRYPEIANFAL